MELKPLPVGFDDFADIRKNGFYYIDKTGMIKDLLRSYGSVNLFTRPRRFGKTLNMSMLRYFFEIGTDPSLFDGLSIASEKGLCAEYMGRFPVIFLSLKQVRGLDYPDAEMQMWAAVSLEADRFSFLEQSDRLDDIDKKLLRGFRMGQGNLKNAILQLTRLLFKHYEEKVIVLIDEYDVPLQKAEESGYYREMVELISQMFGYGMKTNLYMKFAVVTGCLRIAKESIFTGFNNPKINTITDEPFAEWFGFTDCEVKEILEYYNRSEYYDITKAWYDGYLFGKEHVYCPWDVINWCDKLVYSSERTPQNFWANTSGNHMIHRFVDMADGSTREQIEKLIAGESIRKKIRLELTYDEIDDSIENLWSVLYMTGYLTQRSCDAEGYRELVIPNQEVSSLMKEQIRKWFSQKIMNDREGLSRFCKAFVTGDAVVVERYLNSHLSRLVSIRDTQVPEGRKESFYHGLLLGMLGSRREDWEVESNAESGDGYSDIRVADYQNGYGFVLELKYAGSENGLQMAAEAALEQIADRDYERYFADRGMSEIRSFGISFYKKRCRVLVRENRENCSWRNKE